MIVLSTEVRVSNIINVRITIFRFEITLVTTILERRFILLLNSFLENMKKKMSNKMTQLNAELCTNMKNTNVRPFVE